jgi:FtsP/CotA-like multicopper oxidase with cupredoxin domain
MTSIHSIHRLSIARRLLACVAVALAFAAHAAPASPAAPTDRFTLSLVNGTLAGASQTIRVKQGDAVELHWVSDKPMELHLHGYDIEVEVAPGKPATMAFKAAIPGRFPIEPHGQAHGHPHPVVYIEVLP